MLRTYKAIINNDRLKWLDKKPPDIKRTQNVFVQVTIIDKELPGTDEKKETLVGFFRNSPLYNSGIDMSRDLDYGREVNL